MDPVFLLGSIQLAHKSSEAILYMMSDAPTGPITGVDGISEILPLWLSGIVFRPKASPMFVNIHCSKRHSSDDRNEPLEPS